MIGVRSPPSRRLCSPVPACGGATQPGGARPIPRHRDISLWDKALPRVPQRSATLYNAAQRNALQRSATLHNAPQLRPATRRRTAGIQGAIEFSPAKINLDSKKPRHCSSLPSLRCVATVTRGARLKARHPLSGLGIQKLFGRASFLGPQPSPYIANQKTIFLVFIAGGEQRRPFSLDANAECGITIHIRFPYGETNR